MLNEQHNKSLDLLRKFVGNNTKEQLDIFIKKYEDMEIGGPTYAEYLEGLEESFCAYNLIAHGRPTITTINCEAEEISSFMSQPPPPKKIINNSNPAEYAGFLFLHTFVL